MTHLHRCCFHILGGEEERCTGMFECSLNCTEGETFAEQVQGFCPPHEALAQELERIISQ